MSDLRQRGPIGWGERGLCFTGNIEAIAGGILGRDGRLRLLLRHRELAAPPSDAHEASPPFSCCPEISAVYLRYGRRPALQKLVFVPAGP
jgi:hypothetical protein